MNYGAIAHMPDQRYCFCLSPGRFIIRLQTRRGDLKGVVLHYQDKYIPRRFLDTRKETKMKLVASDLCHDYYEAEVEIKVVCLRYFFEMMDCDGEISYYSNCRFLRKAPEDIDRMFDLPQNLKSVRLFCSEDPAKIENYDKAIADQNNTWCCHHRLEIQDDKIYSQDTSHELYSNHLFLM